MWTAGEASKAKVKVKPRRRRTGRFSSLPRSKWSNEINNYVKIKKRNLEVHLHLFLWVFSFGSACVCVCVCYKNCDTLSPAEGAVELHIYLLQPCVVCFRRPVAGWTLVPV